MEDLLVGTNNATYFIASFFIFVSCFIALLSLTEVTGKFKGAFNRYLLLSLVVALLPSVASYLKDEAYIERHNKAVLMHEGYRLVAKTHHNISFLDYFESCLGESGVIVDDNYKPIVILSSGRIKFPSPHVQEYSLKSSSVYCEPLAEKNS